MKVKIHLLKDKPTPPAPSDAEVREAREGLASDAKWLNECYVGRDVDREMRCSKRIRTILAALAQAQESPSNVAWGQLNAAFKQSHGEVLRLRAENARLVEELKDAHECLTIAHMDGYHKGQKAGTVALPEDIERVLKHMSLNYSAFPAGKLRSYIAAQAEQVKRLQSEYDSLARHHNDCCTCQQIY